MLLLSNYSDWQPRVENAFSSWAHCVQLLEFNFINPEDSFSKWYPDSIGKVLAWHSEASSAFPSVEEAETGGLKAAYWDPIFKPSLDQLFLAEGLNLSVFIFWEKNIM